MGKLIVLEGTDGSGLGAEFAGQLAERGYNLVLVARRKERLQAIRGELEEKWGIRCETIAADLSRKESCITLFGLIKKMNIEIFINNAGFGDCGKFSETEMTKELDMIDVNIRAVHILTKLMVGKFRERNRGYLLNVGSSAGLMPAGPFMATYYATKAYVNSLTRAVADELKREGSKVYVGCLCPGPVDTEFNSVANVRFALKGISAEECVKYAIDRMFKKKTVIIPGKVMKAGTFFSRFIPQNMLITITGNQQKRKL